MSRLNACALVALVFLLGAATAHAQDSKPRQSSSAASSVTAAVNINTASPAELQKLPGIGAATANRIVEYREKNGPFSKPEELMNVRGIGEKSFLKLKALVTVTPPKTEQAAR